MEKAPWKLTKEMVEVMGGKKSDHFALYVKLCTQALIEARNHSEAVVTMMEIMLYKSSFPAFRYNPNAAKDFRKRLMLNKSDKELPAAVLKLIEE
jgi:phosphatidylinositol kinase/protein kinase (PI-3  family)